MRARRRRWFREETIAPWATILVIVGLWWAGASLVRSGVPGMPAAPGALDAPDLPSAAGAGGVPRGEIAADDREALDDAIKTSVTDLPRGDRPIVPVAGIGASSLRSTFDEARGGGSRRHEAMDILAPRGTAVLAAVDGRVVKLFTSAAGGLTIYQFDEAERFCYYYAHLDSYAPELTEGQQVKRGQVIGFVGTSGNAPANTPHLHFAIFRLGPEKRWWEGEPLDPITFLR